ncbi:DUF4271 domain-containing protein [Maribacter antarcticus]|uniref:DUF4271 domain-containing protein n=1 Tax=Maribacter antarcticus TaxID=505250 RepID=UPI00047E82D5|nr:DUF4271 domain-containing protein [Maribacter antarcticus]
MNPILRTPESLDWITLIIFGSLLFVLIAKALYYVRFLNYIVLPFNNKYIFMYNKKERLLNWFHVLFTLFQVINTALFLFFVFKNLINSGNNQYPFLYPLLLAGSFSFLLAKMALQLTNGFIFGCQSIFSEIIFKKTSYLNYGGILFFLANILLAYVNISPNVVIFITISLFLGINMIGWILVLKNYQNFFANYFFYFILYLCTLEIAPIVIIGSLLKQCAI